jgi:hypothetical protein
MNHIRNHVNSRSIASTKEEEYNVKLVKPVDGSDGILDASDIT